MNFKSQRKSIQTKFIRTKARSDDLIDYKFPLQNKRKFETNQFISIISLSNKLQSEFIFIIVWFTEDTVNSSDETRSKKSSNKNLAEVKSEQGNEVPMLK